MTNPLDEVSLLTRDGERVVLCYSMNALVRLEQVEGRKVPDILRSLDQTEFSMITLRRVFWAGLLDAKPKITEEDAGHLVAQIGFKTALAGMKRAVNLAFQSGEEEVQGDEQGKPHEAGSGAVS